MQLVVTVGMIRLPPDTIVDRSIVITLKRKLPTEIIKRLDIDGYTIFKPIRQRLKRWAIDSFKRLKQTQPNIPIMQKMQNDRAIDNWTPLFTIAEILGEKWIDSATKAVQQTIISDQDQEDSIALELLTDIQHIFREKQINKIYTDELVQALIVLEERPWAEWRHHYPITQCALAKLLKPFGIRSHQVWSSQSNKHGYFLEDFKEVFARYVSLK